MTKPFMRPHCQNAIERRHIQKHLRLHGRFLTECSVCSEQHENRFNTVCHMVNFHPNESIRYSEYSEYYIESRNDIVKRKDTVLLECILCGVHVDSVAKSMEHFLAAHKSHNINYEMIKP